MNHKIAVFTGTRAEYGLLHWIMKDIQADNDLDLQVIVSGMHLSPEFGETWREITADGFTIDAKVEMLLSSDSPVGVVKSMGLGTIGFADAFERLKPDMLIVLGDRFEALAVVQTALILQIPIAHIHGGEVTEGAYDDAIRHAITKMSDLHFVAAEPYAKRVIQMGENPECIFNVGAVGLDHFKRGNIFSIGELGESLSFELKKPYLLVTYHPVTAADEDASLTCNAMLSAIDDFPNHQVIITYPNADNGGRSIIPLLDAYAKKQPNRVLAIPSLGFERYKAAMKHVSAVIGNSSSGLIEAPSFGVPTVNIGCRQTGRLAATSVINCEPDLNSIKAALTLALSPDKQDAARSTVNLYGMGNASEKIIETIKTNTGPFSHSFHNMDGTI